VAKSYEAFYRAEAGKDRGARAEKKGRTQGERNVQGAGSCGQHCWASQQWHPAHHGTDL
jgi:hypothetical protein